MEDEEDLSEHSCFVSASGWAEGQPEAQVPHCPGQSAKGETAGAATSEEQSNYFFVVYHQLIDCSAPVEIAPVHHQQICMSIVPREQEAVPTWASAHTAVSQTQRQETTPALAGQPTDLKLQRGETRARKCGGMG